MSDNPKLCQFGALVEGIRNLRWLQQSEMCLDFPHGSREFKGFFCFQPWCPDGRAGGHPGGRAAGKSLSGLYLRNRKV